MQCRKNTKKWFKITKNTSYKTSFIKKHCFKKKIKHNKFVLDSYHKISVAPRYASHKWPSFLKNNNYGN